MIEENLKIKVSQGHKIRVAFLVVSEQIFQARPLFDAMLKEEVFEPFIVVIGDVSWGFKSMISRVEKTYNVLSSQYSTVYKSYDNDSFIDFSSKMDMVCNMNPYDSAVHEYYRIGYLKDKGILSFYIFYAYNGLFQYNKYILPKNHIFSCAWKIFLENKNVLIFMKKFRGFKINNLLVTGYCKMDSISLINRKEHTRKKIIIAPHHSIIKNKYSISISNFINYADFILELPRLYANVDFIFRPHPYLFDRLIVTNIWSLEKIDKYLQDIKAIPNMVYDNSGDYFDLFVNSDALIHDCGSFLAEYLYTDHPQCFLLKDEEEIDDQFLPFGKKILNHVYKAFCKEQVANFIDNVVIKEQDYMKKSRDKFANKYIKINYPHATETILKYIKKKLT
ncbi:CDP-glycerol glycerophosphotransferase family protein [Candidatus Endomicrobiellum cubanum]|uniref:CDP-glycerol glycerophosphotransferase family protein n=1 Tax=Candidatus Endomicrobiellum cubanum TaxID=3242325 RepID=UPI00359394F3